MRCLELNSGPSSILGLCVVHGGLIFDGVSEVVYMLSLTPYKIYIRVNVGVKEVSLV